MTETEGLRGECYWCGREAALRIDGTVRKHRVDADDVGWWCRGSRLPPRRLAAGDLLRAAQAVQAALKGLGIEADLHDSEVVATAAIHARTSRTEGER